MYFFKSRHDFYYYRAEMLQGFDDEEWAFAAGQLNALPAAWVPLERGSARSVFGTEMEAWNDFSVSAEYGPWLEK